jgi:hypothetical protein
MKNVLLGMVMILAGAALRAEVDEYNVPDTVTMCLKTERNRDFDLSDRMNPFYLRADFDGDGTADYAVLITQRDTGKAGIYVCFGQPRKGVRIAAGHPLALEGGRISDDLKPFDAWGIYEEGKPGSRKREDLHLIAKEAGSGLLSWTGKTFKWTQLGF